MVGMVCVRCVIYDLWDLCGWDEQCLESCCGLGGGTLVFGAEKSIFMAAKVTVSSVTRL